MFPFQRGDTLGMKSRSQIEDDIVGVFSKGEVNIVGICGMGGAGKTTLSEKILSRMQAQGSFPTVVKVVVARSVDFLKIQQVIFESLDFKYEDRKVKTVEGRARLISSKLHGPKRFLILLDDIWKAFSLKELGIPQECGCATLLTSRDKDVLQKMCDNNVFEIGGLLPDEALSLFEEKAGIQLNDSDLRPTAEQIVQECCGLPLAIVTIGSALRKKGKQIWDLALHELKSYRPIDGTVYGELHKRLIVSYELLDDEDAKMLFLLCSVFPEGYNIKIYDLGLYIMGLKILYEVDSLAEARDRVWKGVDKLKSCYLLLEGKDETEVRMHDVVRDAAISIALDEGLMEENVRSKAQHDTKSKWISMCETSRREPLDHRLGTNFPNLRLLHIYKKSISLWDSPEIHDISTLTGMPALNVLSLKNVIIRSEQEEIKWENTLSTLQLECCNTLRTLSFAGALLNLKILDCNGCQAIEELPVEIGQLKCLKLLNLSGCQMIQRLARGIINQLVELEELKMLGSFHEWASSKENDEQGINAPLNELEALHKLTCLEIEIWDTSLVHERMDISPNLDTYKISIKYGCPFPKLDNEKAICLEELPNEIINDGSWIRKLIATTAVEELNLEGDGSGNWGNLSRTHQTLKRLVIQNCTMLKELVDSSAASIGSVGWELFPMLEDLQLNYLPALRHVCDVGQKVPFNNLRVIKIRDCNNLRNLLLLERAKPVLLQLETLEIEFCKKMEQVFIWNESDDEEGKINSMTFPKLKRLGLVVLLNLTTFCKGSESIVLPYLEDLSISECGQMKSLLCNEMESESEHTCGNNQTTHQTLHLFCNNKVKLCRLKHLGLSGCNQRIIFCPQIPRCFFRTLKTLSIGACDNIRSLFLSSMIENLVNLKHMCISTCDALEEVFIKERNNDEGTTSLIIFPQLVTLKLEALPSLISMGSGIESIEFPMLEELEIKSCSRLKRIAFPTEYNPESEYGCNYDDETLHFLCDEKVKLNRLKFLRINGCHTISSLFTVSAAQNLTALTSVEIKECRQMKKVITGENEIYGNTNLFPSLKRFKIENMDMLEMLCELKCPLELSMLEEISIAGCLHLKFLTSGCLSTPYLNKMLINNETIEEVEWKVIEDLNSILRQHIMNRRDQGWKMGVNVSEPSQLSALLLYHHPLPFANDVRLVYKHFGETLLMVTSNADPMMWVWEYDKSSASSVVKLQQLTDGSLIMSNCLKNDAKSTKDDSIVYLALSIFDECFAYVSGGNVTLYDSKSPANFEINVRTVMSSPSAANSLAFDPAEEPCFIIAIGMDDSTIQIYNWETGEVQATLKSDHRKRICGLAFSGGRLLVSSGDDGQLCMWWRSVNGWENGWEKKKSRPIQAPPNYPAPLDGETRVQFHKNQIHLLVIHESHIGVYDDQLECLCSWYPRDSLSSGVSCALYSCDCMMIYAGFRDGAVGIFDSGYLSLLCRIAPSAYISSLVDSNANAFPAVVDIATHPKDSNQFALGMSDGAIYVIKPLDAEKKSRGETTFLSMEDMEDLMFFSFW